MKTLALLSLFFCLILPASAEPEKNVLSKSEEEPLTGKVLVLKVGQKDLINQQAFAFWQRIIERAAEEEAAAIVLEIDTPGGLAFNTRALIMDDLATLDIPVIAWVEREALSAGAMIAFAADKIYMGDGTTIGSAAIVDGSGQEIEKTMRAKLESAFEASMRSVAKKKERRFDVIQAMMIVDEENERTIGDVVVRKGALLNLTAEEATAIVDGEPLLADGIANSLEEILKKENLSDNEVIYADRLGFERIAYFLASISPLLLIAGIGGAYLELKMPGFGVFGIVSLVSFSLFFFGNNIAGNLAGYELMALFFVGIVLIILELFVLPGGIAGLVGAAMVAVSLWLSMTNEIEFDYARGSEDFSVTEALIRPGLNLALGVLGGVVLAMVAARYVHTVPFFRGMVTQETLPSGVTTAESEDSLLGQAGVALADLRPCGTIRVGSVERDAMSSHGLIPKGTEIVVIEDGMRLLVKPASDELIS